MEALNLQSASKMLNISYQRRPKVHLFLTSLLYFQTKITSSSSIKSYKSSNYYLYSFSTLHLRFSNVWFQIHFRICWRSNQRHIPLSNWFQSNFQPYPNIFFLFFHKLPDHYPNQDACLGPHKLQLGLKTLWKYGLRNFN